MIILLILMLLSQLNIMNIYIYNIYKVFRVTINFDTLSINNNCVLQIIVEFNK